MRGFLLVLWLLLPLAAVAWHLGPGQDHLRSDDAGTTLRQAERAVAQKQWPEAIELLDKALAQLPADRREAARHIRLERAKARMQAKQLPVAHQELTELVEELKTSGDARLLDDARAALASSQYYLTWLMRLEGQPDEVWEPEIDAARQNYKLLAERAEKAGDAAAARTHREDLEAAIRLARLDLAELQGLPLPSQ